MNQGWECPKCGAVYAPYVAACTNCKPSVPAVATSTYPDRCPHCYLPWGQCRGHNICITGGGVVASTA